MNSNIIRHLTPTTLAALSADLEAADRNQIEDEFLDAVNRALTANVGEKEASQLQALACRAYGDAKQPGEIKMLLTTRKRKIDGSAAAAEVFRAILDSECDIDRNKEHFWVAGLDTKNTIQYLELVSLGGLNSTIVHPREVFRFAILKGVASVLLVHNHPSGDTTPSDQDGAITRRLVECGELLGITILDHVIIGDGGYYSFRERGRL